MTAPTPDPGTAQEAAERQDALVDAMSGLSDAVIRAVQTRRELREQVAALSAKVEAVQALCDEAKERGRLCGVRQAKDAARATLPEASKALDDLLTAFAALGSS